MKYHKSRVEGLVQKRAQKSIRVMRKAEHSKLPRPTKQTKQPQQKEVCNHEHTQV